jgi:hypothetical protein
MVQPHVVSIEAAGSNSENYKGRTAPIRCYHPSITIPRPPLPFQNPVADYLKTNPVFKFFIRFDKTMNAEFVDFAQHIRTLDSRCFSLNFQWRDGSGIAPVHIEQALISITGEGVSFLEFEVIPQDFGLTAAHSE